MEKLKFKNIGNKVYTTEEAKEVYINFTKAIIKTGKLLRELKSN